MPSAWLQRFAPRPPATALDLACGSGRNLRWLAEGPPEDQFAHVTAENAGETLFIRSERQTLRKLPETGAIVFTIGIYLAPLGSLSPDNIARMAESLTTIPEPEAKRRGAAHFAPQLQAYAARHGAVIGRAA